MGWFDQFNEELYFSIIIHIILFVNIPSLSFERIPELESSRKRGWVLIGGYY